MSHYHAVVWLDHAEARIFHFDRESAEKMTVHAHKHHLHHKAGSIGSGRAPADAAFFDEIVHALADAAEILLLGPGAAKTELFRHVTRTRPALEPRILGIETVDHPTDGQVVAYARKYFHAKDRMRPLLAG